MLLSVTFTILPSKTNQGLLKEDISLNARFIIKSQKGHRKKNERYFWDKRLFSNYRLCQVIDCCFILNMQCHCNSKNLYRSDYSHPNQTFSILGEQTLRKRRIDPALLAASHPHPDIQRKMQETAELWLPTEIERISWDEITFNPLWFYKKFLSKNIPCVITDVLQGDDVFERWAEPQYLQECLQGQVQSISLTPDGFADSIQGDCFVQPHQLQAPIKHFFERQQHFPGAIPYIQHQNSSLSTEFSTLNYELSQEIVRNVSQMFFKGADPDAENLWLGLDESVSALHKDPYENFYVPIVGEKHFTLLPPHAILRLQEQEYRTARWKYQAGSFTCEPTGDSNRWICVNPDLKEDRDRFPGLASVQAYHVQVHREEMLYLPSLWYHQVSQVRGNAPYTLAVNYWFDMEYSQNFSLYETCRALRNLP